MAKDTEFRAEVAERIGVGFELPKAETVEVVCADDHKLWDQI